MSSHSFSSKIIFVTGKGGVGKSVTAAALARQNALKGRKTLLVELGDQAQFPRQDSTKKDLSEPQSTSLGFDVALWTGTSSLKDYVRHHIKIRALAELFFENKIMRSFLNLAPALNELAILGKITSAERRVGPPINYDCLVVDTFATGHALALLKAPLGMAQAVSQGPIGRESRDIQKVLAEPGVVEYVVVSIPEDLPADESVELRRELAAIVPQKPSLVINKVELKNWQISELDSVQGASSIVEENDWAKYLLRKKQYAEPVIRRLEEEFSSAYEVPLIFSSDPAEVVLAVEAALSKQ